MTDIYEFPADASLLAAASGDVDLRTWDDGAGPLWLYCETMGPLAIVRAATFEDAWNCVVDEILDDADEDVRPDADGNLPECHYYRDGTPASEKLTSSVACADVNHHSLAQLTNEQFSALNITLIYEDN